MRSRIAKEPWPWWCCGKAVDVCRRIMRKREKCAWKKNEEKAGWTKTSWKPL